jgi:hypothetical protein
VGTIEGRDKMIIESYTYVCSCGFKSQSSAAMDEHLNRYPADMCPKHYLMNNYGDKPEGVKNVIEELLQERTNSHGNFKDNSYFAQRCKAIVRNYNNGELWSKLEDDQKEAIDMIFHKIGRIVAGNPDFKDHWDDIAGYATLIAKRL